MINTAVHLDKLTSRASNLPAVHLSLSLAQLTSSVSRMTNLSEDIWLTLGTSYLSQHDRANLSQTSSQMQELIQPILFHTVAFRVTDLSTQSVHNLFGHVAYLQKRVEALEQNQRLSSYIRNVKIIRWLNIPLFWHYHFSKALSDSSVKPLKSQLQSLWLALSRRLFHLVSHLPHSTKICFWELESSLWEPLGAISGPMKHDVLEAVHMWRSSSLELEFSIPENKGEARFSELSYIFQENLAVDWQPISEEYFCDILSAWTLPISRAALNSYTMSRLRSSARGHLHSLKEFRIAAAQDQYLTEMDLVPLKSSPDLGSLSIYAKIEHDSDWLTHVGMCPNLQRLKHLGGSAKIISQLLPLCPNAVSLTFEDFGWSDVTNSLLSPAMTQNIREIDFGPMLDAGKAAPTKLATYFPKLRRLTAFRFTENTLQGQWDFIPLLPELFQETILLCAEFKELEVVRLRFPYKPMAGPEKPIYATPMTLDTAGHSTNRIKEIIIGPQGRCIPHLSLDTWFYEPHPEVDYSENPEAVSVMETVIKDLKESIPTDELNRLELGSRGVESGH